MSESLSIRSAVTHKRKRSFAALTLAAGALFVGGAFAPAAHGAVLFTVTDLGAPTATGAPANTFTGFKAYKLTLSTNDGGLISAVDFGGSAAGAGRGLFSTAFLQRAVLVDDGFGTVTRTLTPVQAGVLNSNGAFSLDSHFLPGTRADSSAPSEDNNGNNPAGGPPDTATSDTGTGTFLTGTFGIPAGAQASSFDLAYFVIPIGSTATFSGLASENGVASPIVGSVTATGVPEPTTLAAAAAVGSVGLLRRRRRLA